MATHYRRNYRYKIIQAQVNAKWIQTIVKLQLLMDKLKSNYQTLHFSILSLSLQHLYDS